MSARILYMEDDVAQARLAKKRLEMSGYMVDIAADGPRGLAACKATDYDAVVVDQTMPGMSGLEVIRTLAAEGAMPPTIMVTGTGSEQVAVEAMKLGVLDYLAKDLEGGFVNMLPLVVDRAVEQHRLVLEKQHMARELMQAQRMQAIGQLASGIAHEINTPTQYIGDNARFLQDAFRDVRPLLAEFGRLLRAARNHTITDDLLAEAEAKLHGADLDYLAREIPLALQQTLEGIEHVASIIGAMREFAHPGNGEKQNVDLNHVIEGAVTLCRSEWKYVAEVVTDFDRELPPVACVPTDINRVVLNLVVNAAHAIAAATHDGTEGKGVITIRTRFDHPCAEIRVEDTGVGIPDEIRDRIFDMFFTTKEVGRGTGQGLALVHAMVVEKHGGTIRVESQVGRGTAFVVRLPISEPAETAAARTEELAAV